jgi:hypothetical protein
MHYRTIARCCPTLQLLVIFLLFIFFKLFMKLITVVILLAILILILVIVTVTPFFAHHQAIVCVAFSFGPTTKAPTPTITHPPFLHHLLVIDTTTTFITTSITMSNAIPSPHSSCSHHVTPLHPFQQIIQPPK